ncbi:MAG: hypothetical protein EBU31_01335 [Proteobacteria bacterium]|nr:hypothetical protein [Pseudomonadota bacterium]
MRSRAAITGGGAFLQPCMGTMAAATARTGRESVAMRSMLQVPFVGRCRPAGAGERARRE